MTPRSSGSIGISTSDVPQRGCKRLGEGIMSPGPPRLAGQFAEPSLDIGKAALGVLRDEIRIGQQGDQLACLVDAGLKLPRLGG